MLPISKTLRRTSDFLINSTGKEGIETPRHGILYDILLLKTDAERLAGPVGQSRDRNGV